MSFSRTQIEPPSHGCLRFLYARLMPRSLPLRCCPQNITTFYGVTASPDWLIVTELLHGSLYKLLHGQTRPVPPSVLRRIAKDVACGAAYIHGLSPSIVHRDINSSNVLLTGDINVLERIVEEGRNEPLAKLSDFGLSRSVERFMTQCTGNAYYLAPGKAPSPTSPPSRRRHNQHG